MANTDYYKWQGYNANDTMVIKKFNKLSAIAEVWERIYWLRHFLKFFAINYSFYHAWAWISRHYWANRDLIIKQTADGASQYWCNQNYE